MLAGLVRYRRRRRPAAGRVLVAEQVCLAGFGTLFGACCRLTGGRVWVRGRLGRLLSWLLVPLSGGRRLGVLVLLGVGTLGLAVLVALSGRIFLILAALAARLPRLVLLTLATLLVLLTLLSLLVLLILLTLRVLLVPLTRLVLLTLLFLLILLVLLILLLLQ